MEGLGPPRSPPPPDLSGLTREELEALGAVLRKEQEFQRQEQNRVERLVADLCSYEEAVRDAATRRRPGDLRLCRLCHVTRFQDGVGRVCQDCHRRVCLQCGSFCKVKAVGKKTKGSGRKWRCRLCQMRREVACRTGLWYHGNQSQATPPAISSVCLDDSESDASGRSCCLSEPSPWGAPQQPLWGEEGENTPRGAHHSHNARRPPRRRSLPATHAQSAREVWGQGRDGEEEEEEDEDQAGTARQQLEQERRLFRQRRQQRKQRRRLHQLSALGPTSQAPDPPRRSRCAPRHPDCPPSLLLLPTASETPSDASTPQASPQARARAGHVTRTLDSSDSEEAHQPGEATLSGDVTPTGHDLHGFSSSSSPDLQSRYFPPSSSPRPSRGAGENNLTPRAQGHRKEPPHQRKSPRKRSPNHVTRDRSPPRASSCHHCQHALGHTREVALRRDPDDHSPRTCGFGMRVVGGRRGQDGHLGAFISMVTRGGAADTEAGVTEGSQVLRWGDSPLCQLSFEAVQRVIQHSPDVVSILLLPPAWAMKLEPPCEVMVRRPDTLTPQSRPLGSTLGTHLIHPMTSEPQAPPRPRRRMLPKTPVEMKKETRRVTGRLLLRLLHSEREHSLAVTVVMATAVTCSSSPVHPQGPPPAPPNPLAVIYLLPHRSQTQAGETPPQYRTCQPEWNVTFAFSGLTQAQVRRRCLEVTVWSREGGPGEREGEVFMGEVLLDLEGVDLDGTPLWFPLADHDENSSPLPPRRPPNPLAPSSADASPTHSRGSPYPRPSPQVSPGHRPSPQPSPGAHSRSSSPGHDPRSRVSPDARPAQDKRNEVTPLQSPVTSREFHFTGGSRDSFPDKVWRKMSNAVSKVSSSLSVSRDNDDNSSVEMHSSRSLCDVRDAVNTHCLHHRPVHLDLVSGPKPLSRSDSQLSLHHLEARTLSDGSLPLTPDRSAPDGDDVTSILGPGQLPPVPSAEPSQCGDVRLGFMVTKGQLEVDVVCARNVGLSGGRAEGVTPPDTYVKTYLVEGRKTLQKKKTQVIKGSHSPNFRKTVKYSACNVHGRHMRVDVWEKSKGFDKKRCLGEAVVRLDGLDLSQHTLAWYRLFPHNAMDLGSTDSLSQW